jgi:hypothetical protein
LKPWHLSLDLEAANQVKHLKNLMLSRPYFDRIPDQGLVADTQIQDEHLVVATRSLDGSHAFLYFPSGRPIHLNLSSLKGEGFTATWMDPRTGVMIPQEAGVKKATKTQVIPPSSGRGNDWVLILDSAD